MLNINYHDVNSRTNHSHNSNKLLLGLGLFASIVIWYFYNKTNSNHEDRSLKASDSLVPTAAPTISTYEINSREIPQLVSLLNGICQSAVPTGANFYAKAWDSVCYTALIKFISNKNFSSNSCFSPGLDVGLGCQNIMQNLALKTPCADYKYLFHDRTDLAWNSIWHSISLRINREIRGKCFNYKDCNDTIFNNFSTCITHGNTVDCTWANRYQPKYYLPFSKFVCNLWSHHGIDGLGDTYSCYGLLVENITGDRPYKAGKSCSACAEGFTSCTHGLCVSLKNTP